MVIDACKKYLPTLSCALDDERVDIQVRDGIEYIAQSKNMFDIILIDSTSINENVLPIRLASIADATIIVSESGKVKQEDIVKAKMEIENVGGKIAGIILNKTI